MPNFQTHRQCKQIQQMSANDQTDDINTSPSTPENFRFFSIINLFEDDSEESIKQKDQERINFNSLFPSYRSFTDVMTHEVKAQVQNGKYIEQTQTQILSSLVEDYQLMLNEYFQSVFSLNFTSDLLINIFEKESMTFGQTKIQKTLETIELTLISKKNSIRQQILRHQQFQKLLQTICKQLPQEINFELLYVANHGLKNTGKINQKKIFQDLFYDTRIKYLNFRTINTEISMQKLKKSFLTFVQKFISLIINATQGNHQNNEQMVNKNEINLKNLKRFALYSSKSDYFKSQDENSTQVTFIPRKKNHF